MGITIKDIAKECGVSVATVSMALSDKPSRVSENTKKKVREIAKKHNYRPNNAAVSLANKKSRLIGIVFNDLRNTHISSLFMAINGVLEKNGYSLEKVYISYTDLKFFQSGILQTVNDKCQHLRISVRRIQSDHLRAHLGTFL